MYDVSMIQLHVKDMTTFLIIKKEYLLAEKVMLVMKTN